MKTPEEYLKFIEFAEVDASEAGMFYFADNLEKGELIKLIQQVQKDAWNEALDKATENATVVHIDLVDNVEFDYTDVLIDDDVDIRVSKDSILKLKL